jgi:hypothetical protein
MERTQLVAGKVQQLNSSKVLIQVMDITPFAMLL